MPQVTSGLPRTGVLIAVNAALALINIRGVRISALVGDIFAGTKVLGLLLFAMIGLFFVDWKVFSAAAIPANANWGGAILVLFYAFTGFEATVVPAAEAKRPRSDMGQALILAMGIAAVTYVSIQVVALGTLPNLAESQRPLADAGRNFLGPIAGGAISLVACISILGNLSNIALICPRLTYAFAERRDFPAFFGRLHRRFDTPVGSIVFFAVIASILAISGTFLWLATVSVVARLVNYLVTCLAVPILQKRSPEGRDYRILFGPVGPIAGVGLCVWLAMQSALRDVFAFGVACLVGAVLYMARPRSEIL